MPPGTVSTGNLYVVPLVSEPEVAERLKQLGLPDDEADAYLALLRNGQSKASDVASAMSMSRPRTYRALDELRRRGLASATTGRPRLYQAVDPSTLFDYMRSQRRLEIEEIGNAEEELLGFLLELSADGRGADGGPRFDLLRKRPAVLGRLRRMVEEAQESVDLLVSHPTGLRILGLEGSWAAVVEAAERGLDLRIVASPRETAAENRALLKDHGAEIELRHLSELPAFLFALVDGREVLVSLVEDPARRPSSEVPVAFATDAEAFVELQRRAFSTCWQDGEPEAAHEANRELAEGDGVAAP